MTRLPMEDITDPLELADWMEVSALAVPDGNTSQGDLGGALRRAAPAETLDGGGNVDEGIERLTLEVFDELQARQNDGGESYPFDVERRGVLQLKTDSWEHFPVYTFCLCLSYFGFPSGDDGPKLFEKLSCTAAEHYISGEAIRFGSPRDVLPSSFMEAVDVVCERVGEGQKFGSPKVYHRKDDGVDVVAWKDFFDNRSSKVMMFGQCAAGGDWDGKFGELDVENFCRQWMKDPLISPDPIRSFFCPHRVEHEKWDFLAMRAGVFFDRCRVSYWAREQSDNFEPQVDWTRNALASFT